MSSNWFGDCCMTTLCKTLPAIESSSALTKLASSEFPLIPENDVAASLGRSTDCAYFPKMRQPPAPESSKNNPSWPLIEALTRTDRPTYALTATVIGIFVAGPNVQVALGSGGTRSLSFIVALG